VLLVCAVVLTPTAPFLGLPAPSAQVALIALSGLALVAQLRGASPFALAVALGAAVPLVVVAPFSDRPAAATLAAGAALAVVGVTARRLRLLREWAPWYGGAGVFVASAAGLAVLAVWAAALVAGSAAEQGQTVDLGSGGLAAAVATAVLVAAGGWLRPSVTVALLFPTVLQAAAGLLD
jgi:hypothetical protein